jgi:hypothetical protein
LAVETLIPRRMFSRFVTGSIWDGSMQRRFRHKWSMYKPSGMGPTIAS